MVDCSTAMVKELELTGMGFVDFFDCSAASSGFFFQATQAEMAINHGINAEFASSNVEHFGVLEMSSAERVACVAPMRIKKMSTFESHSSCQEADI